VKKEIEVEGTDNENLLHNFLEEILFLFESQGFILSKVKKLKIANNKLTGELVGDNGKYEIKNDIKAVTYHEMFVKKINGKFVSQVVLDV